MIIVRRFRPGDAALFRDRAAETWARGFLDRDDLDLLAADPLARTIEADGVVVAAGGLCPADETTAYAWALVAPMRPAAWREVQRQARAGLSAAPFRRIEAHVALDFDKAHRWVRALGFDLDRNAPSLFVNGVVLARYLYGGHT